MRPAPLRLFLLALAIPVWSIAEGPPACLVIAGDATSACLDAYVDTVERCRRGDDATCEGAARAPGGALDDLLATLEGSVRDGCTDETASALGFFDVDDAVARAREACALYGDDFLTLASVSDQTGLDRRVRHCVRAVSAADRSLRRGAVRAYGMDCIVSGAAGTPCDRARRTRRLERLRRRARKTITRGCGRTFDTLGLVEPSAGETTRARIDSLTGVLVARLHRFAQRAYPPNDIGPTAMPGPDPVGVRTFELIDPARLDVPGTGSRPVVLEVYYPSTAAAVAGTPVDPVRILGIEVARQPAHRDVAPRAGTFPLIVYSHAYFSVRVGAASLATHLASHGFVVAAPEHHGGDLVDLLNGIEDPYPYGSWPEDVRFVIDQMLAWTADPTSAFFGTVDGSRVAVVGQQLGAHAALALAGGETVIGSFTDPRVKAIVPQVPIIQAFPAAFFPTVTVPTLLLAGTLDPQSLSDSGTTFDGLPAGGFVAEAVLADGGYNSFTDVCEIPDSLRAVIDPTGVAEACGPYHLPWRYARQITDHLILSFLDGVLNDDAEALARLAPERVAAIEDVAYRRK